MASFELKVKGGPEAGKRARFGSKVVTVGRGPRNDLVLQDGLVSQYHGEFLERDWGYVYRDLRSRHGTLVKVNHVTVNLHDRKKAQEVSLVDGAELMLGESLIRVTLEAEPGSEARDRISSLPAAVLGQTLPALDTDRKPDETIVTRTKDSLDAVAKRLSRQDPRLVSIFKLSRNLNATSNLDEILDLIAQATFEAFKAANFFAISLLPEGHSPDDVTAMTPLISRGRDQGATDASHPLLSHSLLQQVASSRDSVLFVRDDASRDLSESIIAARIMACLAAPLVGQHRLIGVMQADTRGLGGLFGPEDLDLFTVMASYAAFAIERVRLNKSIVEMFEGITRASVTAIDARDPSTAGHSERVAQLTVALAKSAREVRVGPLAGITFSDDEIVELRYAALLHDFGKIGVRESVLVKAERLYPGKKKEIRARFETIKALRVLQLHDDVRNALAAKDTDRAKKLLGELPDSAVAIRAEVDGIRDYILTKQASVAIPASVIEEFRRIGKQSYTDLDGEKRPYLTTDELESLCIPFGTLTRSEWLDMQSHAARSRQYLNEIPWNDELKDVPAIAGRHHERMNGSGYPDGLSGEDIPPQARMLAICDAFDAMTAADRPYRKALPVKEACRILRQEADEGRLDADLVELFIDSVVPVQWPLLQQVRKPGQQ